jgi:nucleoside phosphorylase
MKYPIPRSTQQYKSQDYTVGLICALDVEGAAVEGMLDEEHPTQTRNNPDNNQYTLGRIGPHNVAIATLPSGSIGLVSIAIVAMDMLRSFPGIRYGFMIGIAGGVWSRRHDIRLGDVVVSEPEGVYPGVIQYDLGKVLYEGKFERRGVLEQPPAFLRSAVSRLKRQNYTHDVPTRIGEMVWEMATTCPGMGEFSYQDQGEDRLFIPGYPHQCPGELCNQVCLDGPQVDRENRPTPATPKVHYGTIASGNLVLKDSVKRDRIAEEYGVKCFEMEAAGLMNNFPCLVIRGISDYADSHKNDNWQPYASATAAAYARLLLTDYISAETIHQDVPALERLGFPPQSGSAGDQALKSTLMRPTTRLTT